MFAGIKTRVSELNNVSIQKFKTIYRFRDLETMPSRNPIISSSHVGGLVILVLWDAL
jgi:hypothetical protein